MEIKKYKKMRLIIGGGSSLKKKALESGFWVFALQLVSRGIRFIRTIVLARLLSPNDFGLMGIAFLVLSALETFSQTGFNRALIQKKKKIEGYLDTAWTVQFLRGLILFLILFLTAPIAADFFHQPAAVLLIRIISFSELFKGLTNVRVVYFQKRLEFQKQFIYQLSGDIFDFVVVIFLVFISPHAWILAFGLAAGDFVRMVVSYIIDPYRPLLAFGQGQFREMFAFGKFIFAQSIILFFITRGDEVLVGRLLGATVLGLYQMGYNLANIGATEITHVVSQVSFPLYSHLQDNQRRLKRVLVKTLNLTTFFTLPVSGGIFVLAPEFTHLFLGEKWMGMVMAMMIICLFGALRSIGAAFGPVYQALARVDIPLKISSWQLAFLVIFIYPMTSYWGIEGTAVAITLSMVLSLFLSSREVIRLLSFSFWELFAGVSFFFLSTIAMISVVWIFKTFLVRGNGYFSFTFLVVLGTIFYLFFTMWGEKKFFHHSLWSLFGF